MWISWRYFICMGVLFDIAVKLRLHLHSLCLSCPFVLFSSTFSFSFFSIYRRILFYISLHNSFSSCSPGLFSLSPFLSFVLCSFSPFVLSLFFPLLIHSLFLPFYFAFFLLPFVSLSLFFSFTIFPFRSKALSTLLLSPVPPIHYSITSPP